MLDKLRTFFRGAVKNERLLRGVYIGMTAAALLLSVAILAAIARTEGRSAAGGTGLPTLPEVNGPDRLPAPSEPSAQPQPASTSAPEEGAARPIVIELDDAQVSALLRLALHDRFEVQAVEAHFAAPDRLSIAASVGREALRDYLRGEGQSTVAALLALAPETLELELELAVGADGEGIGLEARSFSACGVAVSDYLPRSVVDAAAAAISSALPRSEALRGVEVRDGSVLFTLGL